MSKVREIKYICDTLNLSRKELATIINKPLGTVYQYSHHNVMLTLGDISSIYKYLSSPNKTHKRYMSEALIELTGTEQH